MARFHLRSLKISGFRGIADEKTINFNGRSAVIHGGNGTGKSTFSLGLSWILFGDFDGILPKITLDSFLAPLGSASGNYGGEAVFYDGEKSLL